MTDLLPAAATTDGGEPQTDGAVRARVVLDTSVLIADPSCVTSFDDVDVVIPLIVVEELDGLKTRPDDVGRAARTALRTIEELRVRHGGSLAEPVPVGNGGDAADRAQRHPEAPPRRARPRPGELGQPHHRRRPRPGRAGSDDDGVERRRAAHQGRPPRRRRRRRTSRPRRHVADAGRRVVDDRDRPTRSSTACTPPARSPPTPSRPPPTSARTSSPCCAPARSRR